MLKQNSIVIDANQSSQKVTDDHPSFFSRIIDLAKQYFFEISDKINDNTLTFWEGLMIAAVGGTILYLFGAILGIN